jgi:hypothetical protein
MEEPSNVPPSSVSAEKSQVAASKSVPAAEPASSPV